jgi:uncharacterized membrane protein YedE/YeeE
MQHFAPLTAALGGLLIGLAATLLWVVDGRTAGVSNIFGSIYPIHRGDTLWRILFLVGLPIGAYLGALIGPALFSEVPATRPVVDTAPIILIIAGFLVGIGTRVGRGCTSGHGICGLARFSLRSLVAVVTFMGAAMITVFIVRHVV